jgi:5-formyltetrahydrofolate cyclo-ligase
MENPIEMKRELRRHFRHLRDNLCLARRKEASDSACQSLYEELKGAKVILSFRPLWGEIDIAPLNQLLFSEKRLMWTDLEGNICGDGTPELILVPAVAFDFAGRRLGYGRGIYDRLLSRLSLFSIGVAFTEQLSPLPLPQGTHDRSVSKTLFF